MNPPIAQNQGEPNTKKGQVMEQVECESEIDPIRSTVHTESSPESESFYSQAVTEMLHSWEACRLCKEDAVEKLSSEFVEEVLARWIKAGRPDLESWQEEEPFVSLSHAPSK